MILGGRGNGVSGFPLLHGRSGDPRRGAVLTVCAAQASSSSRGGRGHSSKRGRMVLGAFPRGCGGGSGESASTAAPPVRTPGPGAQRPPRGPRPPAASGGAMAVGHPARGEPQDCSSSEEVAAR